MPKVRRRLPELDSNFCRTNHAVPPREHDTAFLLIPTERVLQKEPLISRYFGRQTDQCAMSAYH